MQFAEGLKGLTSNLNDTIVELLTSDWLILSATMPAATTDRMEGLNMQRRQLELQRIRSAYIPELVFRLHHALLETGKEFLPA